MSKPRTTAVRGRGRRVSVPTKAARSQVRALVRSALTTGDLTVPRDALHVVGDLPQSVDDAWSGSVE